MTAFLGPHPDGTCEVCGQRLIRVNAGDDRHPWCQPPTVEYDEHEVTRAVLTLMASGVGAEVLEGGTPPLRAALQLVKLCGRREGDLTLTYPGDLMHYPWPIAWERAVTDLAALEEQGVDVRVGFQPIAGAT